MLNQPKCHTKMASSLLCIPLRNKEFNKDEIRRGVKKKRTSQENDKQKKKKKKKTNITKNGMESKKEKKLQGIAQRLV